MSTAPLVSEADSWPVHQVQGHGYRWNPKLDRLETGSRFSWDRSAFGGVIRALRDGTMVLADLATRPLSDRSRYDALAAVFAPDAHREGTAAGVVLVPEPLGTPPVCGCCGAACGW